MPEPRCLACGYILTGLDSAQCPECGRPFDAQNPTTFTTKPLFDRWRFWLPGLLLVLGISMILFPFLIYIAGFGLTVTLALPICLGALLGFSCRVGWFPRAAIVFIVLLAVLCGLFSMSFVGIFCGLILGIVLLAPLILGVILGVILRRKLKGSSWDQKWYLPALSLLIAPLIAGAIESRFARPYADETVTSSLVLPAPASAVWKALMFYEEVEGRPPLLMRFALPRPLYARGSVERVGDRKVCVYSKGRLVKRVTRRVPNTILSFDVVEQTNIENRSVKLKSGAFEFVPIDAHQTRVTLSTKYEPLLGPRWAWRWAEEIGIHTLHDYVLNGMRLKTARDAAMQARNSGGGS